MDPPAPPPALSQPLTITNTSATANPSQAIPVSGTFVGSAGDFLGMNVDVEAAPE